MAEFFGFGGYTRQAEGFLSWQHLTFVTALMAVMVLLAVFLGKANKSKTEKEKNRGLIWAALLIDGFEIFSQKQDLRCHQDYVKQNRCPAHFDAPDTCHGVWNRADR